MPLKHSFYALCYLLLCTSCNSLESPKKGTEEQVNIWDTFVHAIETADKNKFETLSRKTLDCLPCLDNSEEEQLALSQRAKTNEKEHVQWVAQNKFIYTPAFLDQDYDIIFNARFRKQLPASKVTYISIDNNRFEVHLSKDNKTQAQRYAFSFSKDTDGYKLAKINTLRQP